MRSIDPLRPRTAPLTLRGHTFDGVACERRLTKLSLLLVVKAGCQACDALLAVGPSAFDGFDVHYLAASDAPVFETFGRDVLRSSSALEALEARWPPVYLVIDPALREVVAEGAVFDADQVRSEIAPHRLTCHSPGPK